MKKEREASVAISRERSDPRNEIASSPAAPRNDKITKRRQYGIDYTQVLDDYQILKVRKMEKLNRLPEIDLSHIIDKQSGLSLGRDAPLGRVAPKHLTSVVTLPKHLALIEKTRKTINKITTKIAKLLTPNVLAQTESVKTVDAGGFADYNSLSAWESANEENITAAGTNKIAIAKCRHATPTSTADTTAVTIGAGWDTDATHYIKIWTDPSEDHRHNGVWDTSKYRIEANVDGDGVIGLYEDYVQIYGLQIYSTNANGYGIDYRGSGTGIFGYNIIKGGDSGIYIAIIGSGGIVKAYNNIIYDPSIGIGGEPSVSSTLYAYNNTVYNCSTVGFYECCGSYLTFVAKNNISYNNSNNNWGGSFSGDYNLSGPGTDNEMPGDNSRDGVGVLFADEAADDFHLAYADTGAKGQGMYLSTSTDLTFTDDIDGQTRPSIDSGQSWDIGADQYQATEIYRSVGPSNSSPLANGWSGDTLSISGTMATFSANLADNIGVGDVIVYTATEGTTSNATNSVAFIYGRTSPTQYTIRDVAGHMASTTMAATSRWAVYRAYESLSKAETGLENDGIEDSLENFDDWIPGGGKDGEEDGRNLASSTERWNIACYGDATDTTTVPIQGWTTTADNYIKIYTPTESSEVGTSQRHQGKWDVNKYILEVTDNLVIDIHEGADYIKIIGLQLKLNRTVAGEKTVLTTQFASPLVNGLTEVAYNILQANITAGSASAMIISGASGHIAKIYNNIAYDFTGGISIEGSGTTGYVYNNTVYGGSSNGYYGESGTTAILKNNIAYDSTNNYFGSFSGDYNFSGPADDTQMPGTNSRYGVVLFVDAANDDFHLMVSDTGARNFGTDLSNDSNLAFNDDIDGEVRPGGGGGWDIGADEIKKTTRLNVPLTQKYTSGLVGHWTFNGQDVDWSTNTAYDRSGQGNNGAITNMNTSTAPVIGQVGQALEFDGGNDYVKINQAVVSAAPLTICAWAKLNQLPT